MNKKNSIIFIIIGVIIVIAAIIIFINYFNEKEIKDFSKYAKKLEEMHFPKGKTIYALGEATHGNKEFQELKLEVFKKLVLENDVRAFCLEGDFGGISYTNDYINGDDSISLDDATNYLGFKIYKTEEMRNLVKWMREYNDNAKTDDKLRFYGFDMQSFEENSKRLKDSCKKIYTNADIANEKINMITKLFEDRNYYQDMEASKIQKEREDFANELAEDINMQEMLISWSNKELFENAKQYARCLAQASKLANAGNMEYSKIRDTFMSENITWILEQESQHEKNSIMISGHNGHVSKKASSYCFMGNMLYEQYKDKYFVIGTDYYKTICNINSSSGRKNFNVSSGDILAKQVYGMQNNAYYLDFSEAQKSKELSKYIDGLLSMGTLGDGFEDYYIFITWTYRFKDIPKENYDSMIFVYNAGPISFIEKED